LIRRSGFTFRTSGISQVVNSYENVKVQPTVRFSDWTNQHVAEFAEQRTPVCRKLTGLFNLLKNGDKICEIY